MVVILLVGVMVVIFRVVVVVVMAMVAVVVHVLLVIGMGEQRGTTHLLNVGNFRHNFVASPDNQSFLENSLHRVFRVTGTLTRMMTQCLALSVCHFNGKGGGRCRGGWLRFMVMVGT